MKRYLVVASLLASSAAAQTPTRAEFDSLAARVSSIEAAVAAMERYLGPDWQNPRMDEQAFRNRGTPYEIANGDPPLDVGFRNLSLIVADFKKEVTAKLAAVGSGGFANVVQGDLVVNGRICVPVACRADASYQIQVRGANGANIMFEANLSGTDAQNTHSGIGIVGMSPDLGLRLVQNMYWDRNGNHVQHFVSAYPQAAAGFDSQGDWSFNSQAPGEDDLGTQKLILRTDRAAKQVYWALWAPGWTLGVRNSTCIWCENVRWTVPQQ